MQSTYYIDVGGNKDGPHDLVTMMRRIRAGKIRPDTLIYIDAEESPRAAQEIPDLAEFFQSETTVPPKSKNKGTLSLRHLLRTGWQFTMEHNVMTVYAGVLMLVSFIFASVFVDGFGMVTGGILAWVVFMLFQNFYLIFALRLYRGQPFSIDFINHQLSPALGPLVLASCALALAMAGGLFLLIVPAVLVAMNYIFVPFLILDHRYGLFDAMHASRVLLKKNNHRSLRLIATLIALHLLCLLLIMPVPLALPVFSAALAELYEELSAL